MGPLSGETTVFSTLGTCYSTQNNKYQVLKNTVISPDDGSIVAQNT